MTAAVLAHEERCMSFVHKPVLLRQIVAQVVASSPQLIVDCTLGGAGHARAMLAACPQAKLLGLDRDPDAVSAARSVLAPFGEQVRIVRAPFSQLEAVLADLHLGPADVVLADLGVSSHQLDTPARGFSFRSEGPLDMRMDPEHGETAAELLARLDERGLAEAIYTLGEERHSRRVARAILAARPRTTAEMAKAVRSVVRPAADGKDPATRTFQAIRMLTNRELDELATLLHALPRVVAPSGLALFVTFHSLEDRAVKTAFKEAARGCICPPSLPVCGCGRTATFEVVTKKPVVADADEVHENPRARSAKLRVARRLGKSS